MKRALPMILVLLTGCDELDPFLPKIFFDTLQVEEIDFQQAKIDFVFQVDNPNPVEVGLSSFSYDLGLEGIHLLAGDNEDGFTLEAADASELRLPVDLGWKDTWDTVQATRGLDTVGFGLKGHFGFDTPLGEARLPYDEGGDFPALRTPKFRFKNLRATGLDIFTQTASLELDLGIDNEHASNLFFDRFDYGLTVDGQPLASGLVNTFEVQGAEEGDLCLPIQVNLLTAGAAIVSAITNGGALDIGLGANMDVETPFKDLSGNPVIVPLSIDEAGALNVQL
ncbi:MAG: LEA type 2 family protein [Alphaproteobacteria bacterium]|nr:LEA type 2 family protein [Alphaproteobacteria bacterium]